MVLCWCMSTIANGETFEIAHKILKQLSHYIINSKAIRYLNPNMSMSAELDYMCSEFKKHENTFQLIIMA